MLMIDVPSFDAVYPGAGMYLAGRPTAELRAYVDELIRRSAARCAVNDAAPEELVLPDLVFQIPAWLQEYSKPADLREENNELRR